MSRNISVYGKTTPYEINLISYDSPFAIGEYLMVNDKYNNNPLCRVISSIVDEHEGEMVSGVMFLNLDTIRRNGFLDRARDNYMKNFYMYPDQMALRDSGAIAHLNNAYGYLWDYQKRNVNPIIVHFTNDLEPKIYDARGQENEQYFYRRFPEFAYVRTGLRLIDQINGL